MLRINGPSQVDGGSVAGYLERSWRPEEGTVDGVLDLKHFMRLLSWRARLIAGLVLGAVILTALFLAIVPPKYSASAVVLLDPRQPRVTSSEAVLSGIGSDAAAVESQVELVQSPVLARKVIEQMHLDGDPEFAGSSIIDDIKSVLGLGSAETPERRANRLLAKFQKGLSVKRRGLTYILEISYASLDPKKSAAIANAIAQAYIASQQELRSDVTKDASVWLDDRLEALRQRVRKSEQAVADYKAKHQIVDVMQGNKLIARRMEDVSHQLAVAQLRKAEVGGRLKQIEEAREHENSADALAEILQSQTMGVLRGQYANAARLEAQYRTLYGDQHPYLIAAREQLAELQAQIDGEVARVVDGLRNDYKAASRQEASLEADLAALKQQAQELEQASVPLAALIREAQADRALLEQYLGRLKETDQEQTLHFGDARVVSPALAPLKPSRPGSLLLILAAGVCGLIFSIGLALVLEHTRSALRTPEDVEQYLGLPSLGIIPDLDERRLIKRFPWESRTARSRQLTLASAEYTRSVSAIAMRLRRSSQRASEVLTVASALPAEGKSTFACNLARVSASSGIRTLLIDSDSYTAEISRIFGIEGPGLSELCEGRAEPFDVTVNDMSSGLFVVGAGEGNASRFHDFDNEAMAAILRDYQQVFELIIIDSPAILPTGGGRLIEWADRLVMIADWNKTDRSAVSDALTMLGPHEDKVAGVVLNRASLKWYRLSAQGRYLSDQYYAAPTIPILPSTA